MAPPRRGRRQGRRPPRGASHDIPARASTATMKSFTWRILICVVPLLLGVVVVARAFYDYRHGRGGFRLGVDLVGGTILVYEIDESRWPEGKPPEGYDKQKL